VVGGVPDKTDAVNADSMPTDRVVTGPEMTKRSERHRWTGLPL
jgi:hypothetical protein